MLMICRQSISMKLKSFLPGKNYIGLSITQGNKSIERKLGNWKTL